MQVTSVLQVVAAATVLATETSHDDICQTPQVIRQTQRLVSSTFNYSHVLCFDCKLTRTLWFRTGNDDIGHKPYRPQYAPYRSHTMSISATS